METIHILIAEDHKIFRQLIIPALQAHSICTIGEAEDGAQLMTLLETKTPDIVLLDLEMPVMNGSIAFGKIKQLYPRMKIIFLSTHNENMLMNYFYSKGADAFLSKNADLEVIVETIRLVHENKYTHALKQYGSTHQDFKFSPRESEIIPLIVEGKSNKEIADRLSIGNKAVEAHKKNLFKKTKTQGAVGFVSYILKKGFDFLR